MNRRQFNALITLSYPAWLLMGTVPTAARSNLPVPTSTRLCQHGLSLSCCPHCGKSNHELTETTSITTGVRHE